MEKLEKKQVIADFFYLSPAGVAIPAEYCYDPVIVKAEQTAEIEAHLSTPQANTTGGSQFSAVLYKNDQPVAMTYDGDVDTSFTSSNASLMHREKVNDDAAFKLCVYAGPNLQGVVLNYTGAYQYGFKIYDIEYPMTFVQY